jgi:hypothetical protein
MSYRAKKEQQHSALERIESALGKMNSKMEADSIELDRLATATQDPNLEHLMKMVNNVMETYD